MNSNLQDLAIKFGFVGILTWFQLSIKSSSALIIICALCLILDFVTGMAAAAKSSSWSSRIAWTGLWRKIGMLVAIAVAGLLDLTLHVVIEYIPGIDWNFPGPVFLIAMLLWYTVTELGSIAENASKLGANLPSFLVKAIAICQAKIEDVGNAETAKLGGDDSGVRNESDNG